MGSLVKIVDSTFFHTNSIGYGGENLDRQPKAFRWDRTMGPARVKVWTDLRIGDAREDPADKKIALLVESPAVASCYQEILELEDVFDHVLTFHQGLVGRGEPYLFYPLGGSWIERWGMFPKTEMISLIVSPKQLTEGHRLRHCAAKLPNVDTYGNGVGRPIESKAEALRDYRFAIIIENGRYDYYFSEKLIDALSQGTVPIYHGCPGIGKFFDLGGIIRWDTIEELEAIVKSLEPSDYDRRMPAVYENLNRAVQYQCPENWIASRYEGLLW
jgi:hypothetical protein